MRVRRGPVFITWINGKPQKVENALLPDGQRVLVEGRGARGRMRYWSEADNAYLEGDLVIERHDARFNPHQKFRETFCHPADQTYARLGADIEGDSDFVTFLRTPDGGRALYWVMVNEEPTHLLTGEKVGGFSRCAGLVAHVRDLGENAYDFRADLEWDPPPVSAEAFAEVRRRLSDLGWIPEGYDPA